MTISTTTNKAQFSGSGTTEPFPFTFKVFAPGDLTVVRTSAGTDTTLTITTHYSVSLNADQNNDPGGEVTLVSALAVGQTLTILREVDASQETDITNGGGFYPEVIENALDKLTMLSQQNAEQISRAVVAGVTEDPQTLIQSIYDAEANASASATAASGSASAASASASSASTSATNAAASASSAASSASAIGNVNGIVKGNGAGTVSAAVAGTDYAAPGTASNFTTPQRSALLTDNDGSFDLSAKQNFKCTPTGSITLTFTNQADGLSGSVVLINGSNYAVAAHANTKISSAALTRISATGTYRIDYISDGTNAYCTASESLA